ncbi:MAG: hypothetical protein NTY77_12715 [Elusimicrobia bacterium]|nr:hypothetical protein [Elusimicrobiota bacterium]
MAPSYALVLMWAGLGMLGPAAAVFVLRQGGGVTVCAALLSAVFMAALGGGCRFVADLPRRPLPALAAPATALFCAALLLPLLGLRAVGLAGAALGLAGWVKSRGPAAPPAVSEVPQVPAGRISLRPAPPAWLLAPAGAAAVAWARCLGLLWGHSFYAFCGLLVGAGAGTAFGLWLKGRCAPALDAAGLPRRLFVFVSALAGLLGLCWLRFIGINAGAAEYLFAGLRGPGDLSFIVGQSTLALAFWSALLAMAWPAPAEDVANAAGTPSLPARASGALLAAAGPLAAWALIPRLGAAETAAVCHLALAALSLAADRQPLLRKPVLARVALAGLALALVMGWHCRELFADVWLNRLNAAWAGGRYLALAEDGRELLAVYRFSSGVPVLLRDGAAWVEAPAEAKREAHLPLLLQGSPRRVLMLGVRNPLTLISAMAHGVEVRAVDSHPEAGLILRAQAPTPWPPPSPSVNGATLSWTRADPRRYLRAAGPSFDVIIEELPFPATTPEWARLTTREAFRELRGRLNPAGLAALRLPAPYPPLSLAQTLRTARSVFAHVGGFELPGGYLLACSDQPLASQPAALLARSNVYVQADDLQLEEDLPRLRWDDFSDMPPELAALRPDTDDRPSGFFPLPALAGGLILAHSAAEASGERGR